MGLIKVIAVKKQEAKASQISMWNLKGKEVATYVFFYLFVRMNTPNWETIKARHMKFGIHMP